MELWDLYDKDGKRTGEVWERRHGNYMDIPEGRYHLVSDILVQHRDGTVISDDVTIFDSDVSKEYLRLYQSGCLTAEELDDIRVKGLKRK